MKGRAAYGAITLIFIIVSVFLVLLGTFWLFTGIADKVSDLVLKGSFMLIFGLGVGAVANFLK